MNGDPKDESATWATSGGTNVWFEDLTPCTYFGTDAKLLAVGWLMRGKPFPTGSLDRQIYDALVEMQKDPWQPFVCGGTHECDLCQFESEASGVKNLFIPADGVMYVCPELIVHYINAHSYLPPKVFCEAILACPPMRSMAYRRQIASCGAARIQRPAEPT